VAKSAWIDVSFGSESRVMSVCKKKKKDAVFQTQGVIVFPQMLYEFRFEKGCDNLRFGNKVLPRSPKVVLSEPDILAVVL